MPYIRYHDEDNVVTLTLNRPERKNPLTFESYAELRDYFRGLKDDRRIKAVVITGEGGNFCSALRCGSGPMISRTSPPEQKFPPSPVKAEISAPAATCARSSGR